MQYTNNDWNLLLQNSLDDSFFDKLEKEERDYVLYPFKEFRFAAFEKVPFSDVRVVLCGDEPYHLPNMADGLAYSSMYAKPKELVNIFRKIEDELGIITNRHNYDLSRWAEQGVLLLNMSLTTRAFRPNSHTKLGWNHLTHHAIKLLYSDEKPKVFILLGHSQELLHLAMKEKSTSHLVLTGVSPYYPLFFYKDYFQATNDFLVRNYGKKIDWK